MNRKAAFVSAVLGSVLLTAYGCDSPSGSTTPEGGASSVQESNGDHGASMEHSQSDMEMMKAELAKLSPEDAASAEKQHFCPVSGEMLGTMGAPKKVDIDGRQVWICCDGCKDKLLQNPDEYLPKLPQE